MDEGEDLLQVVERSDCLFILYDLVLDKGMAIKSMDSKIKRAHGI